MNISAAVMLDIAGIFADLAVTISIIVTIMEITVATFQHLASVMDISATAFENIVAI